MSSGGKEPIGARGAGEAGLLRGGALLYIFHALVEAILFLYQVNECLVKPSPR